VVITDAIGTHPESRTPLAHCFLAESSGPSVRVYQRYSLRLVLPHIRFTAKSRAPVGSPCQSRLCSSARRIPQNRAVLASAPLGSAPLRGLTAPPCAPSLANYETNVFYWPAKAQFQPLEANPICPRSREHRPEMRPTSIPRLNPCSVPMKPLNCSKSIPKPCSAWRDNDKFREFKSANFSLSQIGIKRMDRKNNRARLSRLGLHACVLLNSVRNSSRKKFSTTIGNFHMLTVSADTV
jgi:hypothetical protein